MVLHFGLAQGANYILAIISLVICVAIISIMLLQKKKGEDISTGLYLVLIGGIGNFIDRIVRGFVVDFIDTPFIATFNIADSFIVIGAFWVLIEEVVCSVFKKSK